MSRRQQIQNQIASLQAELTNLNRVGDDTFNVGTIMRFAAASNTLQWHIIKKGEETWYKLGEGLRVNSPTSQDLASWIAEAIEANIGYFEVYELKTQASPFFASA